jgi:predicted  nucleic acid-binding Zn-ribbon protein
VENRLRLLFNLQQTDTHLDELHELKGDLPLIVKKLTDELDEKQSKKSELEETIKQSLLKRDSLDTDIITLKEKIEKWKTQQFEVKTNKQYDMLAREIDASQERIKKLSKEMESMEGKATVAKDDVERLSPEIDELGTELSGRQQELDAVNKEHEEEELKLRHEREKLSVRLKKPDLEMYERIRKAKDGRAVVPIRRNACGGCFNRVPPQKALELRKNDMFMTCERCGRLLVSDNIAEVQ